jgi:hypothetical protein
VAKQLVYQVRTANKFGLVRIIHAYPSREQAASNIKLMRSKTGLQYSVVEVENQPDAYWGIPAAG